jgi:hypothetical protein
MARKKQEFAQGRRSTKAVLTHRQAKNIAGAKTRARVEVTRDLIEKGVQKSSSHCPIAEAMKVAMPGITHVAVDVATLRWTTPEGKRVIALTPLLGQNFISKWEVAIELNKQPNEEVKPFSFVPRPIQIVDRPPQNNGPKGGGRVRKKRTPAKVTVPASKHDGQVPVKLGGKPLRRGRPRAFGIRGLEF